MKLMLIFNEDISGVKIKFNIYSFKPQVHQMYVLYLNRVQFTVDKDIVLFIFTYFQHQLNTKKT